MQTHVNPLKPLAALSLLLLLAAALLQPAHGAILGEGKVTSIENEGGTLRETPGEDAPQAQDDADGDSSAEAPDAAEPEAASDETSEPADDSEDSYDEDSNLSEDSHP
jgi:hypothetical protein